MLNQAMSSLEKASGGSLRLSESLETQEAQRDRHPSEIEAIKLEMLSLEVLKKLAVSSRSFKEAGRISEQMRAREEERRALEEQFKELQSSLLTSWQVLVAIRQVEEAACRCSCLAQARGRYHRRECVAGDGGAKPASCAVAPRSQTRIDVGASR